MTHTNLNNKDKAGSMPPTIGDRMNITQNRLPFIIRWGTTLVAIALIAIATMFIMLSPYASAIFSLQGL